MRQDHNSTNSEDEFRELITMLRSLRWKVNGDSELCMK